LIDGEGCVVEGTASEDDACATCDPSNDREEWTVRDNRCRIDDECIADNAAKPGSSCLTCDIAEDKYDWTQAGNTCLINGSQCVDNDVINTSNSCQYCDASDNPTGWTAREDVCQYNGACYEDGATHPTKPCLKCDIYSEEEWVLDTNNWCEINEECVEKGTRSPNNPCRGCRPDLEPNGWLQLPNYTSCGEGHDDVCEHCQAGYCVKEDECCWTGDATTVLTPMYCGEDPPADVVVRDGGAFVRGIVFLQNEISYGHTLYRVQAVCSEGSWVDYPPWGQATYVFPQCEDDDYDCTDKHMEFWFMEDCGPNGSPYPEPTNPQPCD
jgi:hypothetical protein